MGVEESNQITVVVKALETLTERAVKEIVLDCTANLLSPSSEGGTPVDTGWARSNWIPRIGGTYPRPVGSRQEVDHAAQEAGIASVAVGYHLEDGYVTITNNVPYIVPLNAGSSAQAPAGYVQAAILRGVQGVRL